MHVYTLVRWGKDEWNTYLQNFDVLGMTPEVYIVYLLKVYSICIQVCCCRKYHYYYYYY